MGKIIVLISIGVIAAILGVHKNTFLVCLAYADGGQYLQSCKGAI